MALHTSEHSQKCDIMKLLAVIAVVFAAVSVEAGRRNRKKQIEPIACDAADTHCLFASIKKCPRQQGYHALTKEEYREAVLMLQPQINAYYSQYSTVFISRGMSWCVHEESLPPPATGSRQVVAPCEKLLICKVKQCAVCNLVPNEYLPSEDKQPIAGTVTIQENPDGSGSSIRLIASGFSTDDGEDVHGFHIHADAGGAGLCNDYGGHYNPFGKNHGAPNATDRHVGCLGNVVEDSEGNIDFTLNDHLVLLSGETSVIGRSFVIHHTRDDLGLGGNAGSLAHGNAGYRLACCVIERQPCI